MDFISRTTMALCLVLPATLIGQQTTLQGRVSIHNSKYETGQIEYVKDAYVSAAFTKPASSDSDGNFSLEFVSLDPGTSVQLSAEKPDMEVVNNRDLERVVIGQKSPVAIYLTGKGKLAKAQTELYNISLDALFTRKDELIKKLKNNDAEALKELETFIGHPLDNRLEAEAELMDRIDNLQKRLPEFAQNLAKQNLDFASELFIKAYESFRRGEIEKVIQILDSSKLEASYAEARKSIVESEKLQEVARELNDKGLLQIEQIIESYRLKAESLNLQFDYKAAAEQYRRIIEISEANQMVGPDLGEYYSYMAMYYWFDGDLEKALADQERAIEIRMELLDPDDLRLATSYTLMALVYTDMAEYDTAFSYGLKCLEIREKKLDSMHNDLATSYNQMGVISSGQRKYEQGIAYYKKAMNIREKTLDSLDPDLGSVYNNIAACYRDYRDYQNALFYVTKAIEIRKASLGPDHPRLATSYDNIGLIHRFMGDNETAIEYVKKALAIREASLQPQHPLLATSYSNLAVMTYQFKDYSSALDYIEKSLEIRKVLFDSVHPDLGVTYNIRGAIHRELGDLDLSISDLKMAIYINSEHFGEDHVSLASNYAQVSRVYQKQKNWGKALEYMHNAIRIDELNRPPNHPYLFSDYKEVAYIHLEAGAYKKAKSYRDKAFEVLENIPEENRGSLPEELVELDDAMNKQKK